MHRTLRTSNVHFYPWEIRIPPRDKLISPVQNKRSHQPTLCLYPTPHTVSSCPDG